ncbi:MAG TPA: amidohydrolase family protein [Candidatus Dormibacteraeota bacterium]|nr:amidohydrolase family protein [Candidatus Dormibacteraeota bacterium]
MVYKAISADSHIVEPPHLWEHWLPPELRKFAPKLVKDHEGGDAWQYGEGLPPAPIGLVAVRRGRKYTDPDYKWTGMRIDQVNQGAFYGEPRLAEQDEDGVDAEVIYAPVRAGMHFMAPGNDEIAVAGVRAYNDWLHKEFCAVDPKRLVGLALIPNIGLEGSIAELRRTTQMGMKGCTIMAWPSGGLNLSRDDDPFWAEAETLGVPVSIHVRLSGKEGLKMAVTAGALASRDAAPVNPLVTMSTGAVQDAPKLMAEMVYSGMFDRFPTLQIVFGEVNVGWVPEVLESMDDHYTRDRIWTKTELARMPSTYWRTNFAGTFIIDKFGIRNRDLIGPETILWSTDYPHHRCDWPESQRLIAEHMQGVPRDEAAAMCAGNAVRIYKLADGASH